MNLTPVLKDLRLFRKLMVTRMTVESTQKNPKHTYYTDHQITGWYLKRKQFSLPEMPGSCVETGRVGMLRKESTLSRSEVRKWIEARLAGAREQQRYVYLNKSF